VGGGAFGGQGAAAGDGVHRDALPTGPPCDRDGQLARQGLLVEAPFTGDDEVARGDQRVGAQQGEEVVGLTVSQSRAPTGILERLVLQPPNRFRPRY
jgi:hypothetical protein